MFTLDITLQRNNKKLFKKVDLEARMERAAIHMAGAPRNKTLWDYDYSITENKGVGKKYIMELHMHFLSIDEKPPVYKWSQLFAKIKRWFKSRAIQKIVNPDVEYRYSRKIKQEIIKDNKS